MLGGFFVYSTLLFCGLFAVFIRNHTESYGMFGGVFVLNVSLCHESSKHFVIWKQEQQNRPQDNSCL